MEHKNPWLHSFCTQLIFQKVGGRWPPHVWAILDGANQITVSLLETSEPVNTGDVWLKTKFTLEEHELLPKINAKLF